MKFLPATLILLLACGLPSGPVLAQAPGPSNAEPPAPAPALTEAQATSVLNQLKELEAQIMQMRGSNLSSVMARLREGLVSDQAAMNLWVECDNIVNSERKEADKADARQRKEMMERMDRKPKGGGNSPANDNGDFAFAVRLGLQYLVLTLEAHETKDDDLIKMVPKIQDYVQALTAAAPKLKGRAYGYLGNALSQNNAIVDAFSLSPFLDRKNWSTRPLDIGAIYTQMLMPLAKKDDLPGLWDARINAEGTFRKEQMFAPEFELWTRTSLPMLRWQRAIYLHEKGPSPVNAMADMLKVIRENPGHANAPDWVKTLRQLVNQSAPGETSPGVDEAPAGT